MDHSLDNLDLSSHRVEELAEATGVSLSQAQSWKSGEVAPPVGLRRALELMASFGGEQLSEKSVRAQTKSESAKSIRLRAVDLAPELPIQPALFKESQVENDQYLKSQLITYIGNKRALLPFIESGIRVAKERLDKDKIDFLDLFSGSGVVGRMARQHSRAVICNDLEPYSYVVNCCYQTNASSFPSAAVALEIERIERAISEDFVPGFIAELYAPQDDDNIRPGERVFYTRRNAVFLDAFCRALADTPRELRNFILGPLLSQASMYANTSGVFKGFYKNEKGIGQFGGSGRNALTRILRNINIERPVLSNFSCTSQIYNLDANILANDIDGVDIAYFDPPYNQHPYGSNYFMLNLLCDYRKPESISKVSGIPIDWNRSLYNKPQSVEDALFEAVRKINAKFVLISYNSEGFITHERFLSELMAVGKVSVMDTKYNTFRGCRNLAGRSMHVTEFLYLVDKR